MEFERRLLMYSEECATCTKAATCELKNREPDWYAEEMGCPILMAEDLNAQGETVVMVSLPDD